MDITDASTQRLQLGVERFLANESITFRGIAFHNDRGRALQVDSFSEWLPENTTEAHAREKIANSKAVLQALAALSQGFRQAIEGRPQEFFCCYSYGNGAFALAEEKNGKFEWLRADSPS